MSGDATVPEADPSPSLWRRIRYTPLRDYLRGRVSGRLDLEHTDGVRGLPHDVQTLVLTTARRTRLWRLERVDVAQELCAHFRDGLDAGASSDTLVAAFGDQRQAARLIRRAKKRSRPLPWRVMVRTMKASVLAIVAIIVVYVVYGLYFLTGRPGVIIDYRPQINTAALAVPDDERAWPQYRAALLEMDDYPTFERYNREPRPGEVGWDEAEAYLAAHQEQLVLVREAAAMPGLGLVVGYELSAEDRALWPDFCDEPEDSDLYMVLLPHYSEMRRLARALSLDSWRAGAAGDSETIVANTEAMLGIARHLVEVEVLIGDLVSKAILTLTLRTVREIMAREPGVLREDQLQRLAHVLAATDDLMRHRLDCERLFIRDVVQRCYTDDGHGDGRMTRSGLIYIEQLGGFNANERDLGIVGENSPLIAGLSSPVLAGLMLSRREVIESYDQFIDKAMAEASQPLWEIQSGQLGTELIAAELQSSAMTALRNAPLSVLVPALSKLYQNRERTIMSRDATLVVIALELSRLRTGQWPDSLDSLVPELLPALPADRYDGQPLRYAMQDGQPLVYSIGPNRVDEGGLEPKGAAWQYPVPSQPGDEVFWPPRIDPIYAYDEEQ